ncbi:MAG: hypothetical protein JG781_57 [Peptococcaceae bacterium]|uniref:SpoIIIAH-like family protein n=1 Tax=Thermanaerosceptrum fracticalcis TaxID=1712410 RepID=A0A7G6E0C7_THEFR|nr:SpoIIIAH-like family protein [Thermanaerosceptrum fracticalcis]MBZ4652722.1 hypothetical protein [Peptococcaceae bacterium]QNB45531.1 hypothetical protein BR63_03885 [Thermanaerosceptrum fracticalcis]
MTTIFIRMKNLILFGLVLLCISFVWLGYIGLDKAKEASLLKDKAPISEPVTAPANNTEPSPTVTIVPQETKSSSDSFFGEYRIERDRTRSEQVEILREIVNNPNSSAQMRQEAQQKLIKIADNLEKEYKVENALIAKGFKDAVVVIQPESVMVIIASNGLRQDEIARIADMVVKVVGCKMEDVVIVPKTK